MSHIFNPRMWRVEATDQFGECSLGVSEEAWLHVSLPEPWSVGDELAVFVGSGWKKDPRKVVEIGRLEPSPLPPGLSGASWFSPISLGSRQSLQFVGDRLGQVAELPMDLYMESADALGIAWFRLVVSDKAAVRVTCGTLADPLDVESGALCYEGRPLSPRSAVLYLYTRVPQRVFMAVLKPSEDPT